MISLFALPKIRPGISDQDRAYVSFSIAGIATLATALIVPIVFGLASYNMRGPGQIKTQKGRSY
jgi:hypothetical protein